MKNFLYYTREQAEKSAKEYCDKYNGVIPQGILAMNSETAEPCDDFLEKIGSSWQGETPSVIVWTADDKDVAKFGWWEE